MVKTGSEININPDTLLKNKIIEKELGYLSG